VHLANTLPDLEADTLAGVRGLAHTIGRRASIVIAWTSLAGAIAMALLFGLFLSYRWTPVALGSAAAAILLVSAVAAYLRRPDNAALQVGFGMISLATAALAAGWLAGVA
jgi:4-hydroxybenzoate polyprenyltransferase